VKSFIGEGFVSREIILKWILLCILADSVCHILIGQSEWKALLEKDL